VSQSNADDSGSSNTDLDALASRKYQVLHELGRGGTAVVSAGLARGIGGFTKLVVLKNIKEEFLSDRETVRMFVNEARLSARMNHPNVVQVYEVYRQNKLPVIVMEYLDGQSLARVLPRAYRDPLYTTYMAIAILCKVLAGLQYAHSLVDYDGTPLKIVHRDVSPHNVMLTYDGQVKLVDFGIAKLNSSSQDTQTGVIKGKIGYMAPEQVEGAGLDHRADLFAVGVMLWEATARRRMWGQRSDAEIVRCLVLDDVPSLTAAEPDVDQELAGICDRALAIHPDYRYSSAAEFQAALELYLVRRGVVVSQNEVADLVCRTCADLRAASGEQLQGELAKFAAGAPDWEDALSAFDALRTPLPESATRRRRTWLWVSSALLALGSAAGAYVWVIRPAQLAEAGLEPAPLPLPPAAGAAGATAAGAGAAASPALVTLSINVKPQNAAVFLDDRAISPGATLPRDDRQHELRAEAVGYETLTRTVRLNADLELQLELTPVPRTEPPPEPPAEPVQPPRKRPKPAPPAPKPARVEPQPAAPAPERPTPPQPAASCNPPYFIGDDGLKHYRRECL
jgi:serine/threonine-protein kinase